MNYFSAEYISKHEKEKEKGGGLEKIPAKFVRLHAPPPVTLSLELKLPLITRDKKLYKGLLEKDIKDVILFEEIFEKLQDP